MKKSFLGLMERYNTLFESKLKLQPALPLTI